MPTVHETTVIGRPNLQPEESSECGQGAAGRASRNVSKGVRRELGTKEPKTVRENEA